MERSVRRSRSDERKSGCEQEDDRRCCPNPPREVHDRRGSAALTSGIVVTATDQAAKDRSGARDPQSGPFPHAIEPPWFMDFAASWSIRRALPWPRKRPADSTESCAYCR